MRGLGRSLVRLPVSEHPAGRDLRPGLLLGLVEVNKWLGEYTIGVPKVPELDDSGAGMMSKGK